MSASFSPSHGRRLGRGLTVANLDAVVAEVASASSPDTCPQSLLYPTWIDHGCLSALPTQNASMTPCCSRQAFQERQQTAVVT